MYESRGFNLNLRSVPVPHLRILHPLDLLLQLEDTVHERLGRGRAAGHVDVDGDDAVAAPDDGVGVVVVAAAVGAGPHGDDPSGVGHLVVDATEGGGHLVGERARHDDHVRLPRRGPGGKIFQLVPVSGKHCPCPTFVGHYCSFYPSSLI